MKPLSVAFFWHMHQPYYRDPVSGEYSLPWVRLHALRGYYDMISVLSDYPAIRQTFNLVPSLLRQLNDYSRGEARDVFLQHSRKPAAELSPEEKKFILINFFMCHWDTMVKPYPQYWTLLKKRGLKVPEYRWDDVLHQFSTQEFRDLQIWFNLTWFGHQGRTKKKTVWELFKKGRLFSEDDKTTLLETQLEMIQELIPLYRAAQSRGQIEITISPFYHPILPLLIDSSHAQRAMPDASLPGSFAHPEDAEKQILKAVDYYQELFGTKPAGMWPSEGSVSPELIPLVKKAGIRWMASDEGILFQSLAGNRDRNRLFQPYRVEYQGAEVAMVFRDRNLSDLLGFTYSKNPASTSVDDLLTHFKNIQRALPQDRDPLLLIALDGENPWEYYLDGGRAFLQGLYEELSGQENFPTVTVDRFLRAHPPQETIDSLHTGSWIDQNFRIWIGSPEDNQAWDCLKRTRSTLQEAVVQETPLSPEKVQAAWEEIYIAEGSDWFWWYGEDFSSDNDEEFDRLFRTHLSQVHLLLGHKVPDYLKTPIVLPHEIMAGLDPIGLISPILDGQVTHFYEWQEAGSYTQKYSGSSMYRGESFISALYYGFNRENLFFRIDPVLRAGDSLEGLQIAIHLFGRLEWRIVFPVKFPQNEKPYFQLWRKAPTGYELKGTLTHIGVGKIVELAVPLFQLETQPCEKMEFFLTIEKGDLEVERFPRIGNLSMTIPDGDFENALWCV